MRLTVSGLLLIFASTLHAQGGPDPLPNRTQVIHATSAPVAGQPDAFALVDPRIAPGALPALPGGIVSANQLAIPPKALKEAERSQKAFEAGDIRTSIEHLEKAVLIYPPFLQAHNVLGTRYIRTGEYNKSLIEFQRALSLDPRLAQTYHNLSTALYFLRRFPEAEASARQALKLDPLLLSSRYMLGRILFAEQQNTPEEVELFRQSAEKFPNARLYLARIAEQSGDTNQAVAQLQEYMKAPDAEDRHRATCWLAQLSHSAAGPGCAGEKTIP